MSVLQNLEIARLRGIIESLRRRAGEDAAWLIVSQAVEQEAARSKYLHDAAQKTTRRVLDPTTTDPA